MNTHQQTSLIPLSAVSLFLFSYMNISVSIISSLSSSWFVLVWMSCIAVAYLLKHIFVWLSTFFMQGAWLRYSRKIQKLTKPMYTNKMDHFYWWFKWVLTFLICSIFAQLVNHQWSSMEELFEVLSLIVPHTSTSVGSDTSEGFLEVSAKLKLNMNWGYEKKTKSFHSKTYSYINTAKDPDYIDSWIDTCKFRCQVSTLR